MLLSEKIDNSYEISRKKVKKVLVGIKGKIGRAISVASFFVVLAITIFTKILVDDFTFDLAFLSLILNLLSLLAVALLKKSIFSKNHYNIYFGLEFINQYFKLMTYGANIALYIAYFNEYGFSNFSDNIPQFIMFIITVVLCVPVLLFFIRVYYKLIPPFCIFFYLMWLCKNAKTFIVYEECDDKHVYMIKRRITAKNYVKREIMNKIVISFLGLLLLVGLPILVVFI